MKFSPPCSGKSDKTRKERTITMAQLLLGKEVTASLNEEIRRKVAQLN